MSVGFASGVATIRTSEGPAGMSIDTIPAGPPPAPGGDALGDVQEAASHDPDIVVILLPPEPQIELNALERAATIAIQKPLKADFTIDAVPTLAEIDRALAKLENLAKERGTAVGVASALPISIDRIGVWIKALESHGIMLVPLTTAMLKSKSS